MENIRLDIWKLRGFSCRPITLLLAIAIRKHLLLARGRTPLVGGLEILIRILLQGFHSCILYQQSTLCGCISDFSCR